jgi:hypothetical protein
LDLAFEQHEKTENTSRRSEQPRIRGLIRLYALIAKSFTPQSAQYFRRRFHISAKVSLARRLCGNSRWQNSGEAQ